MTNSLRGAVGAAVLSLMMGACTEGTPVAGQQASEQVIKSKSALGGVVGTDASGKPTFITGELGTVADPRVATASAEADFGPTLQSVASQFQLDASNLVLKKSYVDAQGDAHYRYGVLSNGLPIYGGELLLHVRNGSVFAANTNVHGELKGAPKAAIASEAAAVAASQDRASPPGARADGNPGLVYLRDGDKLVLTYEVRVQGELEDGTPMDDSVFVNALTGDVVERYPHIHTALNRKLHDGKTLSTLPGVLTRVEGQEPVADAVVNTNYDHLGTVYNCYQSLFGRDSYTNTGATLISTVHHRVKYVNAFWNGTQMVYGDGDNVTATNLANSLDVTAHELTHAVTDNESDLIYSGESGGLNESMSDIFGAVCEWYGDGKVVSSRTWLVGDDIWTPNTPGDALRYMDNPTKDGSSLDYYPDYASGVDVHYSSGISNLAFYLMSQGGKHPRGKTTTIVNPIGIEKAARIFYKANVDLLTPSSNFEAAKLAMEQAAVQLGYDAATKETVSNAWKAVGVGVPIPPPPTTPINKNVPITNLSGTRGSKQYFSFNVPEGAYDLAVTLSGGTGDADLYLRFNQAPTTSQYDCRPYKSGNNETCLVATAQKGTYYVMLNAFSAYSGVTLTVTWKGGYLPIENGVEVTGISGPAGYSQIWTIEVPARAGGEDNNLHVRTYNGAGNGDIYVKNGSSPNHSDYECRGVNEHNTEVCNLNNVRPGKYYIMVFGARGGIENLSLSATHD